MTPQNHTDRYRQIAGVLARHGLGFLLAGTGPVHREPTGRPERPISGHEARAREARMALEELGPTFVKLGQLLSTRRDLLPDVYIAEFSRLQDAAPAVRADAVARIIEDELGAPPAALFAAFEPEPMASASLGQAHAATLQDGTAIVVKVRRPDVVPMVQEDLEIIQNLAERAGRVWRPATDWDLPGLARQFARSLHAELDYLREGRSAERFAANFAEDPTIHIPRVHWDRTTTRILTLDRITGIKVDDPVALDAAGVDRRSVVRHAMDAIARMVFVDGFFHADPHPGNFFIEPGGRIGLIDFGMVGRLDPAMREHLSGLFVAVAGNDPDLIATALIALSVNRTVNDRAALRSDIARFTTLYEGSTLGEVQLSPLLLQLLAILRRHALHLPTDLALLVRMLLLVDGIGARLDPEFSLAAALKPYATRLVEARLSSRALASRAAKAGAEAAALGLELPGRLRRLLDLVDSDGVELHLRAAELDPLVGRIERVGNRLVAGLVASALIGGVGQLVAGAGSPARSMRRPLLDAGLGAVGLLGAYLAWTSRRRP